MTIQIKPCYCGKPANQLAIIKGGTIALCTKHVEKLEQWLGEKLEPLTKKISITPADFWNLERWEKTKERLLLENIQPIEFNNYATNI